MLLLPLCLVGRKVLVKYNPDQCHHQVGLPSRALGGLSYLDCSQMICLANEGILEEARNIKGWWKVVLLVRHAGEGPSRTT